MAYIPTIHTFQDDLDENRSADDLPISGRVEDIHTDGEVLQRDESVKGGAKVFLILVSVFFLLASIGAVGYYFYDKKQKEMERAELNRQATENAKREEAASGKVKEINKILPNLSNNTDIKSYLSSATFNKNTDSGEGAETVTLEIKRDASGASSYTSLYALILANEKEFKMDLVNTFKLKDVVETREIPVTTYSTTTSTTSTTTIVNKKKVVKIIGVISTTSTTTLVSTTSIIKLKDINEIKFSDKTIENQDYKVADAGVSLLVYGYVSDKYLVAATSIKNFLLGVKALKYLGQ